MTARSAIRSGPRHKPPMNTPQSRRAWFHTAVAPVLLAATVFTGCGPRSDRLAIHGKVTLDGAALDNGSIRFSTAGGGKLFSSGAMIKDGVYDIPQEKGLPPGKYRVEISSPDTKAKPIVIRSAPGEPQAPPMAPERVPAEYNVNSTKTIDVDAAKDNAFNFDIASRPAK